MGETSGVLPERGNKVLRNRKVCDCLWEWNICSCVENISKCIFHLKTLQCRGWENLENRNHFYRRKKIEHSCALKLMCCNNGQPPRGEGHPSPSSFEAAASAVPPCISPAPSVRLAHLPQNQLLLWGISVVLNCSLNQFLPWPDI